MAKHKQSSKKVSGPYLAAAFFCESTIEDKQDGALSIIRMVDQINVKIPHNAPPNVPSEEHRLPVLVNGLLSFRTGASGGGERAIRLVMQSPSGKKRTVVEQNVPFTPQPWGGANLRFGITVQMKTGGLFWLLVYLDGKPMARMPFMIAVEREPAPPGGAPKKNGQ